jgi:hypothetical protein
MKPVPRADGPAGSTLPERALAAQVAPYVVLALYGLLAVYVLWRSAVLAPFSDEFNWAFTWYQFKAEHRWLDYLLAPHNLNRLAWTRALIALDMGVLGGTNWPLIVSGAIALTAMATLLGVQAARAAPDPLKPACAALAAMLTLMAGNVLDASLPINVTYTHAAVFAVGALVLAEGAPRSAFGWRGAGALICAVASGFGSGAGLALWPVLAWGALRRRDWRWLALVLAAGVAFVGLYFTGQHEGAVSTTLPALQDPTSAAVHALNYLTLPLLRLAPHEAWIAGALVGAVALSLALAKGGLQATPSVRIACAFILFSLTTAAMAALGRTGLQDAYAVPIRYGLLVAPLQTGVLMLAVGHIGPIPRERWRHAQQLGIAAVIAMFALNAVFAVKVIRASDQLRELIVEFHAGVRKPEMLTLIHPTPKFADEVTALLHRDGLFQHELHLKQPAPAR